MKKTKSIFINVLFIICCCLYLFPIYMVLVNAFKNRSEIYENILSLPSSFSFEYFTEAMKNGIFKCIKKFIICNADIHFYYCNIIFYDCMDAGSD